MIPFQIEIKQKKSMYVFIFALVLMLVGSFIQFKKSLRATDNDFRVYYKTSQRLQDHSFEEIYTRSDGAFPFRYVPYTLPFLTWMAKMPEPVARKIWVALQSICFALGFYYLHKSLMLTETKSPLMIASLSFILTYRQFMDSLWSGQVAGFIFLSFSLGLFLYLKGKLISDGVANSIASSLKIFPGLLLIHGLIKSDTTKKRWQYLFSGILLFLVLNLLCWSWLFFRGEQSVFFQLWNHWIQIIVATGEYFDGSTPKSQSLRAFLLRTFGKSDNIETLWKGLTLSGVGFLIVHWLRGNSKSVLHNAYSYSLGILAFIIFMPESLPYQLMNVAIPFTFFLADEKLKTSKFHKFTLVCFLAFISFASTDFIGRKMSDELQALSFAFFVLCMLSFIMVKETRKKA